MPSGACSSSGGTSFEKADVRKPMKTPPQILWQEAGEPTSFVNDVQRFDNPHTCATCGGRIRAGLSLEDTFTGNEDGWPHFADMSSESVCRGCDFLSNGRWKDQFRLWSILWSESGGLPDHHPSVYEHIETDRRGIAAIAVPRPRGPPVDGVWHVLAV